MKRKLSIYDKIFIVIFLMGCFLRLYNLKGTLQFLGDQGRDTLIVSKIFKEKNLVFIGPTTSVGNMYLGPLYYYFMLPFLWISYPSPMGPVYAVAVLGIATLFLLYFLGKKMIGAKASLIASFFYAFSSTIIKFTRFSWNPNPAPLLSIILIYCLFKAQKNAKYYLAVFISLAILLQLHYLTLLAAGTACLIWLIYFFQKKINKQAWKYTLIGFLIFLLSFTPLILFDLKHNFLNLTAFKNLFIKEQIFTASSGNSILTKVVKVANETEGRAMHILFEYMIGKERLLNQFLVIIFGIILFFSIYKSQKNNKQITGQTIVGIFLACGILGTAFYEHTICDHYIAYLYPIAVYSYGIIFKKLLEKHKLNWLLLIGFSIYFINFSLQSQILKTSGWTIDDMQNVSQVIVQKAKNFNQYSVILLGYSNDLHGQNYRYFLSTTDHPPIDFEKTHEADAVFIIDEYRKGFEPQSSPIYEIKNFSSKNIAETINIPDGPLIHVLRK